MTINARVAVLPPGSQRVEIRDVELPAPGPWDVVVAQQSSGVCHSQLHIIDNAARQSPMVLGHEAAGTVTAVGERVESVKPGDDVLVTWLPRRRDIDRTATPTRVPLGDGTEAITGNIFTWGTHTVIDEQFVVKVERGTPPALASVVGCAVMTGAGAVLNSVTVEPGSSVVIWGVGGVGQSAVAAARTIGASSIVAVDLTEEKLELARSFGATHAVNGSAPDAIEQILVITETARGRGADYVFDCIGRPETVRLAFEATRKGAPGRWPGGTVVMVGAPAGRPLELDGMDILIGEKSLVGSFGGSCEPETDFPTFLEWHRDGTLDLDRLVTNRYKLDEANEAVADLRSGTVTGRAVLEF